jgi:hypothetical protein
MFSAGGSASTYTASGLERCVRDIQAAAPHVTVASANYQMAGMDVVTKPFAIEVLANPSVTSSQRLKPAIAQGKSPCRRPSCIIPETGRRLRADAGLHRS